MAQCCYNVIMLVTGTQHGPLFSLFTPLQCPQTQPVQCFLNLSEIRLKVLRAVIMPMSCLHVYIYIYFVWTLSKVQTLTRTKVTMKVIRKENRKIIKLKIFCLADLSGGQLSVVCTEFIVSCFKSSLLQVVEKHMFGY